MIPCSAACFLRLESSFPSFISLCVAACLFVWSHHLTMSVAIHVRPSCCKLCHSYSFFQRVTPLTSDRPLWTDLVRRVFTLNSNPNLLCIQYCCRSVLAGANQLATLRHCLLRIHRVYKGSYVLYMSGCMEDSRQIQILGSRSAQPRNVGERKDNRRIVHGLKIPS